MGRDVFGHFDQDLVPRRQVQLAVGNHLAQQNLDIYFVIRRGDACRIVYEVRVDASAAQGEFDPPELGNPEVGAFADHLAVQLAPIDPQRVVDAVAGS